MKNQYERIPEINSDLIIKSIDKFSIAQELGLEEGDKILSINSTGLKDELDFIFLTASDEFEMEVEKENGEIWEIDIQKEEDENLGINLKDTLSAKTCENHCLFCFIDQMPKGMRDSLYIKDDDERLSFINGNYITLTNLSDSDLERICQWKIPINISIHTTDLILRRKLLGNIKASRILDQLKLLYDNQVEMNAQIVLVPDLNDKTLRKTLDDLKQFIPYLCSVSVVPVGITKYREHLYKLRTFKKEEAEEIINLIESVQKDMLEEYNNPFVYPADEFYLIAQKQLPEEYLYGSFNQLENGVGMVRNFIESFKRSLNKAEDSSNLKNTIIITGKLFEPILKDLINLYRERFPTQKVKVIGVENNFFGKEITVTGLLTGEDILKTLKKENLKEFDQILIPQSVLRNSTEIMLDDMTITDLVQSLDKKIIAIPENGESLLYYLTGEKNE